MKTQNWPRRLALLAVLGFAFSSPAAVAATDIATLTVGRVAGLLPIPPFCLMTRSGYAPSYPFGSYSPTGLTGGKLVIGLEEGTCNSLFLGATFAVSGFSVDPGHLWLTSVTCNGVTNSAAAASFSYSSGKASWSWNVSFGLKNLAVGTNVNCSIVHN